MGKKLTVKNLVLTAVFAALAFIFTYSIRIPVPATNGYIHIGDSMIYLAASVLPLPYACIAGAIGGGLSDLLAGYMIYVPLTVIVKALIALPFTSKRQKFLCPRNIVALFICVIITAGGYFIGEALFMGYGWGALESVGANVIQAVGCGIVYAILAIIFDKTNIKSKLISRRS